MDSLTFDDVPFENETAKTDFAAPAEPPQVASDEISFDDVPMEEESGWLSVAGRAAYRGAADAVTGVGQTAEILSGDTEELKPETAPSDDPELDRLLSQTLGEGWSDPNWWVSQIAYGTTSSSPMLAAGIGGAAAGSAVAGPGGAIAGGIAGGAAGAMVQTLGPAYVRGLADGLNQDEAFERAWVQTGVSGVFGGVAGALPMVSVFGKSAEGALKAPVKEALFQMFVAQPGAGVTEEAVQTKIEGDDITLDKLATAYVGEAATGAVMDAGAKLATGGYKPESVTDKGGGSAEETALKGNATTTETAPAVDPAVTQAVTETPVESPRERALRIAKERDQRVAKATPAAPKAPAKPAATTQPADAAAAGTEPSDAVGADPAAPVPEQNPPAPPPQGDTAAAPSQAATSGAAAATTPGSEVAPPADTTVPPVETPPTETTEAKKSELFDKAVEAVLGYNNASVGFLIGRLGIGEKRARKLQFELEDAGVISKPNQRGIRSVIKKPVTSEGNLDTGTVQESEATLEEQRQALAEGKRRAVFYPEGTQAPPPPEGSNIKRFKVEKIGIFDYDQTKIEAKSLREAAKAGRLNEVLDLGPVNKEEVAQSAAAGNQPVAVVERTPEGTEVKAAAGTEETVPEQVTALEATKAAPENAVAVEDPRQVVADRQSAAPPVRKIDPAALSQEERDRIVAASAPKEAPPKPRVLADVSPEAVAKRKAIAEARAAREAEIAKENAKAEKKAAGPVGSSWTDKERAERAAINKRGDDIAARFAATDAQRKIEGRFLDADLNVRKEAQKNILERAKAMVTAANAAGLTSRRIYDNVDESMNFDSGVVTIQVARDLINRLKNKKAWPDKTIEDHYQDFLIRETLLKGDGRADVVKERRAEVETAMRRDNTVKATEEGSPRDNDQFSGLKQNGVPVESNIKRPDQVLELREEGDTQTVDEVSDVVQDQAPPEPPVRDFGPNYTAASKGTAGVKVEAKKKRKLYKRESIDGEESIGELQDGDVLQEVTFAEALANSSEVRGNNANKAIVNRILTRLGRAVGKTPIKIVSQDALDAMFPDRPGKVDGFYDADNGYIVMSERYVGTGSFDAQFLAHEGVHAYLHAAIESDSNLKKDIQDILDFARDQSSRKDAYGFKNVHEFLSEALSNQWFQNHLMGIKVPARLASKFDMPKGGSLWEAMIHAVKKHLGLGNRDVDALSYVLRLADRAAAVADQKKSKGGAMAREGSAFARWFGRSKVVDANGNPLVVYHGTMSDFTSFARDKLQSAFGDFEDSKLGFFFTNNPRAAALFSFGSVPKRGTSGTVMPVYLSIQNPLVVDMSDAETVKIDGVPKFTDRELLGRAKEMLGVGDRYGFAGEGDADVIMAALREQGYDGIHVVGSAMGKVTPALARNMGGQAGTWDVWIALDPTQIKSVNNKGTFDPNNPDILARERDFGRELRDAGVPDDIAKELEDFINAEMGKSIDPSTVGLLVGDLIEAYGTKKVTSESMPKGRGTRLRNLAIKTNTLDYIRQQYNPYFNGLLDKFIKPIQKRDKIVADTSERHDRDAADFMELMRLDRKEAVEMASIAMEATRFNVQVGPKGDNTHLGKNAKKGLQGKKRLVELNARFDKLKPNTQELYQRMVANYRETHNNNIRALAYNILTDLTADNRLSNSDLMMLLDKVVAGTLTQADADLIGNPELFKELKTATSLKTIKGDYFPQMRFGEFVVLSEDKVPPPGITSVTLKGSGKTVKVKSWVEGGTVKFKIDPSVRGAQVALDRAVTKYIQDNDLTLLGVKKVAVDRETGRPTPKGEQALDRDYDVLYEVQLQNKGVNFFESRKEAEKFRAEMKAANGDNLAKLSEVLDRRVSENEPYSKLISGSALTQVTKRIDAKEGIPAWQKKQMHALVEQAIISQMVGNRAQARHMARRNVKGASQDIARSAVTYGQSAGNYYATLTTAPEIRKAFTELERFESANEAEQGAGVRSQVMKELRKRQEGLGDPLYLNKYLQNVATLSFLDKLVSPAYLMINFTQVVGNTLPYLGGKYGNAKTGMAVANAYAKMGVGSVTLGGIKNTVKATKDWKKSWLDTDDLVGSVRKKLGPKYAPLLDELEERGLLETNSGFEIGQTVADGAGPVSTAIAKADRIARQAPAAVEVVNRVVTAVAAFDLATSQGNSIPNAVQEAYNTVSLTQGDYRGSNNPRFMRHPMLSWALQFKKYAVLQVQLVGDMYAKAFKGASKEERSVARKQLANMMAVQTMMAGTLGLPGLELIKVSLMLVSMLFPDLGPEEMEEELKQILDASIGEKASELIRKGVVTRAIGIDVSGRMSQADLITGFTPDTMQRNDLLGYAGSILLGAPGSTLFDWADAAKLMIDGEFAKAFEKAVPIKMASDTVRAYEQWEGGKMTPYEAAVKSIGFQPARMANIEEERGAEIKEDKKVSDERKRLYREYVNADTPGELVKVKARIREFNEAQPKNGRKLSIKSLEKKRQEELNRYTE